MSKRKLVAAPGKDAAFKDATKKLAEAERLERDARKHLRAATEYRKRCTKNLANVSVIVTDFS